MPDEKQLQEGAREIARLLEEKMEEDGLSEEEKTRRVENFTRRASGRN